jgi:hypothetical protein
MAKKCTTCDHIYAGELKLCPACGKPDSILVANPNPPSGPRETMDGVTFCAVMMLLNGVIGLLLPIPQVSFVSIALGLLLLLRIEKAIVWVKALQWVKLIIIGIMLVVKPDLTFILAIFESLVVLGLLSSNEKIIRLSKVCFGVLVLIGIGALVFL